MRLFVATCAVLVVTISHLHARADEPPKTLMTIPGELLLSEDFAQPVAFAKSTTRQPHPGVWSDGWRVMNGKWSQVDGGIRGIVLPKIYPAATLHFPLSYQDVVIQVDVRLDDIPLEEPPTHNSNSAKVVLREANAAHIASAQLSKNGFSAAKDKTQARKLNDTLIDDKELSFGKHSMAVKQQQWHTITIEVMGEEMLSTIDGKNPILGSHPILGIPKGILSFGTSRSASYRHLRVYKAQPHPEWGPIKATITSGLSTTTR